MTRAQARQGRVQLPDIPDAGQPVLDRRTRQIDDRSLPAASVSSQGSADQHRSNDDLKQLMARVNAMETATGSLPAMSMALEQIQAQLAAAATGTQVQKKQHASDASDEEEVDQPKGKTTSQTRSYYSRTRQPHKQERQLLNGYDSDSSSDGEYLDKSYATGHEEPNVLVNILPFHSRPKGPPHVGLRSIKPANRIFDKLMSYRSYRLMVTTDTRTSRSTAEVRVHVKNLNLTMKKHTFDGSDPIKIFDFLTRFVNEADMLAMSEAQAFIALPSFLADPAETQFRTNLSGGSRKGGVTCWPEAIQYLLRTYATPTAMREALEHLRNIRQGEMEAEEEYRKRLNQAIYRCGNVHEEDEKMTYYIDGLSDTIRMVVARYRESIPRRELTFESLCHFARSEDDAHRARYQQLIKAGTINVPRPRSLLKPGTTPAKPSIRPTNAAGSSRNKPDIHLMDAKEPTQETPVLALTPEEPEVKDEVEEEIPSEGLYYINNKGERRKLPPYIRMDDDKTGRVGWIDKPKVVCYTCYEEGHTSPQCTIPLNQLKKVLINFEQLSDSVRESVPDDSYKRAKAYLEFKKETPTGPKENEEPKMKE